MTIKSGLILFHFAGISLAGLCTAHLTKDHKPAVPKGWWDLGVSTVAEKDKSTKQNKYTKHRQIYKTLN